jgi:hypothetical protein
MAGPSSRFGDRLRSYRLRAAAGATPGPATAPAPPAPTCRPVHILHDLGDADAAEEHRRRPRTLFAEIGMPGTDRVRT